MRFTLLLLTLLGVPPAAAAQEPPPANAAQLESEGRYEEALAAYQQMATRSPDDHGARLAVGRLQERLGHPERAEAVYRSVMLEDAGNVAALLGVARTALAQWRPDDAIEALERAEGIAPQNRDVLTLLGEAHAAAAQGTRSVDYFARAAAVEPTANQRILLERARNAHGHRVDLRTSGEDFDAGVPDARYTEVALTYRLSDRLRVHGRGEHQDKFDVTDARGGAGMEWRWMRYTTLIGQALVGPDNVVMPGADYLGGVAYTVRRATWLGTVRYFDFDGLEVTTLAPSVAVALHERASIDVGYALSLTGASGLSGTTKGHSAHVRGNVNVHPRVWVNAGYARGVDDFDHFSLDRTGDFRADTGTVGVRVDLPWLTTVVGAYELQKRENDMEMQRLTISLSQRF